MLLERLAVVEDLRDQRQALTDQQLTMLWLHSRPVHALRAYRADDGRQR